MIEKNRTFKLKQIGNSWGIYIDKDLRELLGYTQKDLKEGAYLRVGTLEKVDKNDVEEEK